MSGGFTVANGVLYDDCFDYPYSWSIAGAPSGGWSLDVSVTGPDGSVAATDFLSDVDGTTGSSSFFMCGGANIAGVYTISGSGTGYDSDYNTIDFTLPAKSFRMTLPTSVTTAAAPAAVDDGKAFAVSVLSRRASRSGWVSNDYATVGIQRYLDGRWQWLGASTETDGNGRARFSYTFTGVALRLRAVTIAADTYQSSASALFTVRPTPLALKSAVAGPTPFYPLVRDGFKDSVLLKWYQTQPAPVTALVTTAAGTTIYRRSLGTVQGGNRAWRWTGRNSAGKTVRPGTYYLKIVAKASNGTLVRAAKGVVVKTAWITSTKTVYKEPLYGKTSSTGSCSASKFTDGTVWLSCYGSGYAQVAVTYSVPPNATGSTPNYWYRLIDGLCCPSRDNWLTKPTSTTRRQYIRVTGEGTIEIAQTSLTYRYRHKI